MDHPRGPPGRQHLGTLREILGDVEVFHYPVKARNLWMDGQGAAEETMVQARRLLDARGGFNDGIGTMDFHIRFVYIVYLFSISRSWDARDKIFAMLGHPRIKDMGT